MKNNNDYHMNVGGASMILLLIVFALTVFAALSVRASFHEMKLAEKTRSSVEEYYRMDEKATAILTDIREKYLLSVVSSSVSETGTFVYDGATVTDAHLSTDPDAFQIDYSVKSDISEKKLYVSLLASGTDITVRRWALSEDEHGDYENGSGEDIWNGDIIIIE